MKRWQTWMTLTLMILSLGFLTASDVECEDGDLEFDWPSFDFDHDDDCCDGGYYYYDDCGRWCWGDWGW